MNVFHPLPAHPGHHGERLGPETAARPAQPVPQPGQVRPAPGAVARVLPPAAAADHRRRAAQVEPGRGDDGAAALPEAVAHVRLQRAPAVRQQEGILLPDREREQEQVFGQVEGPPVSAHGREERQVVAEVAIGLNV